jgi:hypothetical protein
VKVSFGRDAALYPAMDETFDVLTMRYHAAAQQYQELVNKHARLNLSGGKPSAQQLLDEELAFDVLDSARHALLHAASEAHPTLH